MFVIARMCQPSKVTKAQLDMMFAKMHKPFLRAFYTLEKAMYTEVCNTAPKHHPSTWPPFVHRLVVLCFIYTVVHKPGNEGLLSMLHEPHAMNLRVRDMLQQCEEEDRHPKKRSHMSAILPKHKFLPIDYLQSSATHILGKTDVHPTDEKEDANMDVIGMVMDRFMPEEFPLDILLFIEEDWQEKISIWKKLRETRAVRSLRKWTKTIQDLPPVYKRYVKYILLLCKRYWQAECRYSCQVKCVRNMDPQKPHLSSMVTFCSYCREFLTFVDMSKRPPSFGHYMNADTLQQFCHRDESDKMKLIPCIDVKRFVNLQFGHPDRQDFMLCEGRRSCFNLVGFPDGHCPDCTHTMTKADKHRATCLDQLESTSDMCKGCQTVLQYDEQLLDVMQKDALVVKQEELKARECKEESEKQLAVQKDTRKRQKMKYLFEQAMYKKQRRLLAK